jgi:uncharacterized membrane protein
MTKTMKGVMIASAVASMFASSAFAADKADKAAKKDTKADEKVACTGVNECKAKGECSGPGHDCAGSNECKGKGWITLAAKDCKAKGGKALDLAKK